MTTTTAATTQNTRLPKVSVAMITYNHEKFIEQAIGSVLKQKVEFGIELVIGEDCSTDSTRSIVRKYAEGHKEVISPILHPRNVGMHANYQAVLRACRGKYIACLEGDDYWICESKLQKQVDLLEANPAFSICCHRTRVISETSPHNNIELPIPKYRQPKSTIHEIVRDCFFSTCSAVYKRERIPQLPAGYEKLRMGEWPLWILMSCNGDIAYIDEVMAHYRSHDGGSWTKLSEDQRLDAMAEMLEWINPHLPSTVAEVAARRGSELRVLARRNRYLRAAGEARGDAEMRSRLGLVAKALREDPSLMFWRPYVSMAIKLLFGSRGPGC